MSYKNLAYVLLDLDERDEARRLFRRAYAIFVREQLPTRERVARVLRDEFGEDLA